MIGSWLLLKLTIACDVSWDMPNHSSIAWGGFVSERIPGVRGGRGTSQPNFTIAENAPPMSPTSAAIPGRRRAGSVLASSEAIQAGTGTSGAVSVRGPAAGRPTSGRSALTGGESVRENELADAPRWHGVVVVSRRSPATRR